MNINQLPQLVINKYLTFTKQNKIIISEYNNNFKIISIKTKPYWKLLFKDDKNYYKIFYEDMDDREFKKIFKMDKTTKKLKVKYVPIVVEKYNILDTFRLAIENKFFDNIAIVKNFIKDDDKYIGYVYPICKNVEEKNYVGDKFNQLYNNLCKNINRTNIIYTDLYYENMVEFDNKFYLIDLDSLANLKKINFKDMYKRYSNLSFSYKDFIIKQFYTSNI